MKIRQVADQHLLQSFVLIPQHDQFEVNVTLEVYQPETFRGFVSLGMLSL